MEEIASEADITINDDHDCEFSVSVSPCILPQSNPPTTSPGLESPFDEDMITDEVRACANIKKTLYVFLAQEQSVESHQGMVQHE